MSHFVSVTMTRDQFLVCQQALNEAKQRDVKIASFTGESAEEIEERYGFFQEESVVPYLEWESSLAMGYSFS